MKAAGDARTPRGNEAHATQTGHGIKELFRAAARAVIQTLALTPAQRRKRREETGRGFKMTRAITVKVTRSIFRRLHAPHDPEQQRAEAERLLLWQMEEWTNAEAMQQQESDYQHPANDGLSLHL